MKKYHKHITIENGEEVTNHDIEIDGVDAFLLFVLFVVVAVFIGFGIGLLF